MKTTKYENEWGDIMINVNNECIIYDKVDRLGSSSCEYTEENFKAYIKNGFKEKVIN